MSKALDELYVHKGQLGLLIASDINITGNDIKYLRADLVVKKEELEEWAKTKRDECLKALENRYDNAVWGEHHAILQLIEKLQSL